MKKILLLFYPAAAAATLVLWGVESFSSGLFYGKAGLALAFGRLAGITAALGVAGQALSMTRASWLEPLTGAFPPVKWHHRAGLAIPLALLVHPPLIVWHHALKNDRAFAAQFLSILRWEDVPAAAAGAVLLVTAALVSLPFFKNRLGYPAWKYLHLLTYAGLALAIGHQLEQGGDLTGPKPFFAAAWYAMLGFTALNALWWRLLKPALAGRQAQAGDRPEEKGHG